MEIVNVPDSGKVHLITFPCIAAIKEDLKLGQRAWGICKVIEWNPNDDRGMLRLDDRFP